MAEFLLDHGADVNAADGDGDTPLHLSLRRELIFNHHMVKIYIVSNTKFEKTKQNKKQKQNKQKKKQIVISDFKKEKKNRMVI